jgi:hypothetical protein
MTEQEIEQLYEKARQRILHAREHGTDFTIPGDPWANNFLAKLVNTKEKTQWCMTQRVAKNKANTHPTSS